MDSDHGDYRAGLLSVILMGLACTGQAQEILRSSQGAYDLTLPAAAVPSAPRGNIQLGDLGVSFRANLEVGYDDNLTLARSNPRSDFYVAPGASMTGFYPLGQMNSLTISCGLAYKFYLSESDYDQFSLTPGSRVALNFFVDEYRFHVYNDSSFSVDPFDDGSVSGQGRYGGLRNAAGLVVSRDFNLFALSLGYERFNFISTTSSSDPEERSADSLFLRAPFKAANGLVVGPESGVTLTRYAEPLRNDSDSLSAGLFATWQATDYIRISPRVGMVYYDFKDTSVSDPTPDATRFYYEIRAQHQVNRNLSYSLHSGLEQRPGVNSDLLELFYVRASASILGVERFNITPEVSYEHGANSGSQSEADYDRFWVSLTLSRGITDKLNGALSYRFAVKDSSNPALNYTQNLVSLRLSYTF